MPDRFDIILDECITRLIADGESVEACLARYPDLAAELEPHLRLAGRMALTYASSPSAGAKERGRQRLRAELEAVETRAASRQGWRFRMPQIALRLRPRLAAVAASLLLAIFAGGASVVGASGDALPGETLYPVKRTVENVRLALELSDAGEAELRLSYARRRAREMATLLEAGDLKDLSNARDNLRRHLTAVQDISVRSPDRAVTARLRSLVGRSAALALTGLQSAILNAPESARDEATDSFRSASLVYGNTVETAARSQATSPAPGASGNLQIRAGDPPPPGVEQVLVGVSGVAAHLAAGADSRWVTVQEAPRRFDLLRVAEVQEILGERRVPSGTYTRIRFRVTDATIVIAGAEHTVRVPSGRLNIVRPFRVRTGALTTVVLDFDGARSLRRTGRGRYMLAPVVRVLAQEPTEAGSDGANAETVAPSEERGKRPRRRRSPLSRKVKITGTVEEVGAGFVVVNGKRVQVGPRTDLEKRPELGQRVEVELEAGPGAAAKTAKIRIEEHREEAEDRERRSRH